jgi:hypothetical protein
MKTNYFSKVENKYVFNISLIVWHLLIAIATVGIAISLLIFIWGIIPAAHKKVEKQEYPEKASYPVPVAVSLNDLNLDKAKTDFVPEPTVHEDKSLKDEQKVAEDLTGKNEYTAVMDTFKILMPPSKFPWESNGYYNYPYGKNYWDYYQNERYREWIVTEYGINDYLKECYRIADANNYLKKTNLIRGYLKVLKLFPEVNRKSVLWYLMSNTADNIERNEQILNSIASISVKIDKTLEQNTEIVYHLTKFGVENPNDGISFIEYMSTIIEKFDKSQQLKFVDYMANAYTRFFDQDLNIQKEATNLYLSLLPQLSKDKHASTLPEYFKVYLSKNSKRNEQIRQIEFEYDQSIQAIEEQYLADQAAAEIQYEERKIRKEELRLKALGGIGGGILLIITVATFLAFLSIQRSVRKMEETLNNTK